MTHTRSLSGCVFLLMVSFHVSVSGADPPQPVSPNSSAESKNGAPNIVFILADDLGYGELGCYGQDKIRTPTLDRFATQGVRLTQHHCGAPVCAPSRCTLMTGLHGGHAEIRGNRRSGNKRVYPGQWPVEDGAVTIAEVLRKAGYATGGFGKWGLGPTDSSGSPLRQGFDRFFGYNCQYNAHSYYPLFLDDDDRELVINRFPIPGHHRQPTGVVDTTDYRSLVYAPDRIVDEALQFIDRNKNEPFFLYVPLVEPHVAMQPPQDWVDQYPEQWDRDHGAYRGQNGYLPHPRPRAAYAAMISDLDEHVDRILRRIERHKLRDRTMVIFTSDNGPTHGGKDPDFDIGGAACTFFDSAAGLRGRKGSVYQGGIQVPALVRFPDRIPANQVCHVASYFPDWFATLCDVAGVSESQRPKIDGTSILPALLHPDEPTENFDSRPMIWEFYGYGGQLAVREGRWKLIRQRLRSESPGQWELYDLQSDPGETKNVFQREPIVGKRLIKSWFENRTIEPDFAISVADNDT